MTHVSEILTLDLQEDIKHVIDLEDRSENEIQQEIESYIVTEGLGQHLYNFTNIFTSNIKETGVWLSGFYGSGKSYFGKMLGYIIDNPKINGTPARDRFIPRLKGVKEASLIENAIRNLAAIKSRVIFLDVAKQNTDKGLSFTLFTNFLKQLGFRNDLYGYMEFDLFIEGKLDAFKEKAQLRHGQPWDELKISNHQIAKVMRSGFDDLGYSEADYADTKNVFSAAIDNFSANQLKIEIEKYLKFKPDETLVFIFDEASEAISQKKFTLLDLEGISEALSSFKNKVWTIAIAQEKLDSVIDNANVNRSQLTKVTDRFKTKIHLESTEVDVIIRSRLLHKTEVGLQNLMDYFKKNDGLVSDATNLKSSFPTKTSDATEFATYYPFHNYQFHILQKFLFSSNALVSNQIAARGMIITTFDVLRKQMRDTMLYHFATGPIICSEAQTAPPPELVNKYDSARKILKACNSDIDGEKLLKTIHFLADSEVVSPNVENITKSYIADITTYYEIKPLIESALEKLLEAKVVLFSNHNYKITSDLEGKLLEEMRDFEVELFNKKRALIIALKDYKLFGSVVTFNDGSDSFKFTIQSDQDDELSSGSKSLKLTVYSLFNITGNRQDFIESLKLETQHRKDIITLVPDNQFFAQIDKLIGEVSRYVYMEDKYSNESDPTKRQIIRDFSLIREEKQKELRLKVEQAYQNASLIYMFDEYRLNPDSFKSTISDTQRKLIKNVYFKRLASSLSEGLVPKVFSITKESLCRLFSGDDFRFFDGHGNFIGDHLKVVEEINSRIKDRYVDGRTLETDLLGAPWGYSFGTIVTTLAVLLRAGRLTVKYNSEIWFSPDKQSIQEAFTNTTKFKSAAFKSIIRALGTAQKNQAVQLLIDLEIERHTSRKVDWNINDFDLADRIRDLADHFIGALTSLSDTVAEFDTLFPTVATQKQVLLGFSGKITENNYIEKVEYLLANDAAFTTAIQTILKTQKFIKTNFTKVKEFKRFIEEVVTEIRKADRIDTTIHDAYEAFKMLYTQDMVKNYSGLSDQYQIAKDAYFKLLKNAAAGMSQDYQRITSKIDAAERILKGFPADLNTLNQKKLEVLKRYCTERIIKEPELDLSISCKHCGYSLSDILNYMALAPHKENELIIIQSDFISERPAPIPETKTVGESAPSPAPKKPRKVRFNVSKIMTVQAYKSVLAAQLTALATASPEEEIEIEVDQ